MLGISRLKQLFSTVTLTFNKQNKAAYLTLTNSKKRNPLSLETITLFNQKLNQIQKSSQNGQVKIVIIKGEGTVFSAGHDLKQLKASKNPIQIFEEYSKMMLKLKSIQSSQMRKAKINNFKKFTVNIKFNFLKKSKNYKKTQKNSSNSINLINFNKIKIANKLLLFNLVKIKNKILELIKEEFVCLIVKQIINTFYRYVNY